MNILKKGKKNRLLMIVGGLIVIATIGNIIEKEKDTETTTQNMVEVNGEDIETTTQNAVEVNEKDEEIEKTEDIDKPKQDIYVKIAEKVIVQDDGKVKIKVNTNLPDGAELLVSLYNEEFNYNASSKVVVLNGEGESEAFSNKGEAVPKGKCKLSISMSLARFQNESVRDLIGELGEYLKGDLVQASELETLGNHVSYEKIININ